MDSPFQEESFNDFVPEEDNQEIDNEEREEEEDVEEEKEMEEKEEEIEEKEEIEKEEAEEEREVEVEEMQEAKEEEPVEETKEDECDEQKEEDKEENEQNEENEIMVSSKNKNEETKEDGHQTLNEVEKKESMEDNKGKEDAIKYETPGPENETTSTTRIKSLYANELKKEEKPNEIKQTFPTEKKEKSVKKSKLLYGCDYMRTTLSRLEVNLPKYINKIVKLGKPKEKSEEKTEEEFTIESFEKTKEITKITSENIPLVYPILKKKHVPVILSKKASAVDEETYNMYKRDSPDYKPYIVPIEVYVPKYLNPEVGYDYMNYEIKDKDIDMEVKTKLLEQLNPHLMFYDYYKCDPYRILSDYYNLASLLFKGKAIMKEPTEIPRVRQPRSMKVFYRRIKIVKKKVSV